MKDNITLSKGVPNKWEAGYRLRFIEARLYWNARINRADIVGQFGISQPQASTDLRLYQELAPKNAVYDKSAKTYRAGDSFSPIFDDPAMDQFVGHQLLEDGFLGSLPQIAMIPTPQRQVNPAIMRKILIAAREGYAVQIHYQSMSSPAPKWRWISPHAFGHDGHRWHVRAYCADRETFLDFVLGRISEIGKYEPCHAVPDNDAEWHEEVDVKFGPHHDLTATQAVTIEKEYAMEAGVAVLPVRRAMLFYILVQLRLDHDDHHPPATQIRLINPEIRKFLSHHPGKRGGQ